MATSLIEGSTWELTSNANYIPAGRYTFLGQMGEFLLFGVGQKIQFGLAAGSYRQLLRPVAASVKQQTSTEDFLDRYTKLLMQPEPAALQGAEGLTFCALDPSLSGRFKRLRRRHRPAPRVPQIH
jgi:hypothetical protein